MNSYVIEYLLPDNMVRSVTVEECWNVPEALAKFRAEYGDEAAGRIQTIHIAVL